MKYFLETLTKLDFPSLNFKSFLRLPFNRDTEEIVNINDGDGEEDMDVKTDIFTISEGWDENIISHEVIDNETLVGGSEKNRNLLRLKNIFSLTKMKKLK